MRTANDIKNSPSKSTLKKNTLYVNLQILADSELIKYRKAFSLKGIVTVIEPTPKGKNVVGKLFELLEVMKKRNNTEH
ncbi:hypothetical protein [Acidianus sp. HS-5]|uniref:hypothetical protein n=1 Tax=Acidianus sp. HS-5 TaxID=2886040 RepID=UPI001F42261B|nr:hypothetical protein [Acidianus sp. HS-5]BDC17733.1 hypothetical protein HS5_06230 [Acidianus sp. HS-5]